MYILFDIGGTKTRVAASSDLKKYGEPIKFETPKGYQEGIEAIANAAHELSNGEKIKGAAGGIRGFINKDRTGIVSEVVLTEWVDKRITDDISKALGCESTILQNDTAIVGMGEAHFGAGKGYDIVAYMTVSTGVGGVRIDHGEIDAANLGFEPGHSIIDIDNTVYGESMQSGSLENFVSGSALQKRRGVKPYEIPQDDPVWEELASQLAIGVKNTIVYWSPDVVVLGGSMIVGDPRIFREDIVKYTKRALDELMPTPPILDAKLGDEGGLYGAMALLSQSGAD